MYIYVYINYRSKSLPESTKKISLSYIRIYIQILDIDYRFTQTRTSVDLIKMKIQNR